MFKKITRKDYIAIAAVVIPLLVLACFQPELVAVIIGACSVVAGVVYLIPRIFS